MLEPITARDLFIIAYGVFAIVGSMYLFSAALLLAGSGKWGKRKGKP